MSGDQNTKPQGDHVANVPKEAVTHINVPAVYASSFQLMYAGNDVALVGSVLKPVFINSGGQKQAATILEPVVTFHMSAATAKDLASLLNGFVEFYETQHGELKTEFTQNRRGSAEAAGE